MQAWGKGLPCFCHLLCTARSQAVPSCNLSQFTELMPALEDLKALPCALQGEMNSPQHQKLAPLTRSPAPLTRTPTAAGAAGAATEGPPAAAGAGAPAGTALGAVRGGAGAPAGAGASHTGTALGGAPTGAAWGAALHQVRASCLCTCLLHIGGLCVAQRNRPCCQ